MRRSTFLTSALAAGVIAAGAFTAAPALADNCPPAAGGAAPVASTTPPPLRQEAQPPIPGYGYIWTPGYWGWNDAASDYYWISGAWEQPPTVGLLWTPPWWGYVGGVYVLTSGYWGPVVGFYGGVDYGWGYGGFGYDGGYWRGRSFYYNTVVNNFGAARINTAFTRQVTVNRAAGRTSFNGGRGGVSLRASGAQLAALRSARQPATGAQAAHFQSAALDPRLHASALRAGAAGSRSPRSALAGHAAVAATGHMASASFHQHAARVTGGYPHHAYAARGAYGHVHGYARAAPSQRAFAAHAAGPAPSRMAAHAAPMGRSGGAGGGGGGGGHGGGPERRRGG